MEFAKSYGTMRVQATGRPASGWFLLISAGIAGLSAASAAYATAAGAELSHDSVAYLAAARSLLDGQGLVIPFGAEHPIPFTHWPPLYPLGLALGGILTHDVDSAARWLSVALFALNTMLVAVLARKFTGSAIFGCGAAFLFASSFALLRLHAMVMTEPLFITFALICIYFLDEHLGTAKTAPLMAAATAAGLSAVTRYAGVPFIVGGALIIFLRQPSAKKSRISAAVWTVVAAAPELLVAVWNVRNTGTLANGVLWWHPQNKTFFIRMLSGMTECILPESLPHRNWFMVAGSLVLAPFVAVYVARRPDFRTQYLTFLVLLYVGFLIAAGFVADAPLDARRGMEPMFPFLVLIAAIAGSRLLCTRAARLGVVTAVCAAIALPNFPVMSQWAADAARNGHGFGDRHWRESPALAFIQSLPAATIIYTNLPEPVSLITGRRARFLPAVENAATGAVLTAAVIDSAVSEVTRQAHSGNAAAVYFLGETMRLPIMISGPDLAVRCGLMRVMNFDDATIYLPPVP